MHQNSLLKMGEKFNSEILFLFYILVVKNSPPIDSQFLMLQSWYLIALYDGLINDLAMGSLRFLAITFICIRSVC